MQAYGLYSVAAFFHCLECAGSLTLARKDVSIGPATLVSAAHIDSALVQHVYLMDPGKGIFERREAVRGKHWRSLRSTE